jgi:hypothetical protein
MAKAKEFDRRNPRFAHTDTGVASNHSSVVPSTDHTADESHAQQDDALQDVTPPQDPNMSGMTETEDCYTWLAGKLDGWKENDDYREFFEQSKSPDSRLWCDTHDGDYDDNGGFPTAIGNSRGVFGPERSGGTKLNSASGSADSGYGLGIIVRRI